MFMRYLKGGVGHQNQDKRWTPSRIEEDGDDTMDVDPAPERDTHMDEDSEDARRMQAIRDLATKMTSGAAGDDRDVESSYNSDDSSDYEKFGVLDEHELLDHNEDEEDDEFDFGPYDGEADGHEDTGFDNF
jgi:hypothetical protein